MGLFDSSDSDSQKYLNQALQAYQNVNVPTIGSGQINNLPLESVQGTINPAAVQVANQAPSAFANISLDPATRAAQMAALGQYTNIANAGGLDAQSKLALQQAIDAANVQSQGAQGAIMNQAQAMGQGGEDFALTQRALAAQGASNTAAEQGLQTAAMAEANRQNALNQMANIGGSVNAADFGQAGTIAAAQNQINAANQAATNAAYQQNAANQMGAQQFNVSNAQGVNAANTGASQNQAYYNASLPQQQFNNQLAKAGGIAGVSSQQASAAQNAQNAGLGFAGSLLGAAGTIGGAYLGGPMGAAIGGQLAGAAQPRTSSSAPIPGGYSTPTGANANPSRYGINMAKGGYTCYAEGGVSHDHSICEKLGTMDLTGGGHVVARDAEEKAEVPGDDEKNDKIPAELSEGELVIPRSVPKTGKAMEEFARNAPVGEDTSKRVDMTNFIKNYRRGR